MTQLTNEMIIENFNSNTPFLRLELILLVVMFLIFGIVYFIKLKKETVTSRKKDIIIVLVITLLLISIPIFERILKYDAINYSIKNNSWYVETDTVARTKTNMDDDNKVYYVYLTNRGKVSVDSKTYNNISKGNTVYVVIAKGRFGEAYATSQIYPTSKYIYNKK